MCAHRDTDVIPLPSHSYTTATTTTTIGSIIQESVLFKCLDLGLTSLLKALLHSFILLSGQTLIKQSWALLIHPA